MKRKLKQASKYLVCSMIGLAACGQAGADTFPGPYYGEVTRVIDGDNFEAKIEIWPTISATVSVRIRGIDAPELFRPGCSQEALGAAKAKKELTELLPPGTAVRLEEVQADDFSGRVQAVAYRQGPERGRTLEELMLNRGTVATWEQSRINDFWCKGTD